MKRDIQINFGVIGSIAEELYNYQHALETIEDTVNSVDSSLGKCSGESAEALRDNKAELLSRLGVQKEEVSDLFSIFNDYYYEMTAIIAPVNYGQMMRVDRNDVWLNLNSIDNSIEKLKSDCKKLPVTSSVIGADDDDKVRWARNYNRLQNAKTTYEGYMREISRLMDELWDIHNNKIIPFENKDDEFAKRAGELYNKYTDFGERLWDNLSDIFSGIWDFVEGAFTSIIEMIGGIIGLVFGLIMYVICGIVWCCTAPFDAVPYGIGEYLDDVHGTFSAIFNDPILIFEGLAQEFSDMYETDGLMYCIGYVTPEIVLTFASGGTAGGVKGADAAGDAGRIANKLDNIGDIAHSANVLDNTHDATLLANAIDNINDYSRGVKKFDDVIDDFARLYSDNVNSNELWKWDDILGSENLTEAQRRIVRSRAIESGSIPYIPRKPGTNYPDFEKAGVICKIDGNLVVHNLPKSLWDKTNPVQFKWLDSQLPGGVRPGGYTWHHSEIPGRMELVPSGIHNSTYHIGGRGVGWAGENR